MDGEIRGLGCRLKAEDRRPTPLSRGRETVRRQDIAGHLFRFAFPQHQADRDIGEEEKDKRADF